MSGATMISPVVRVATKVYPRINGDYFTVYDSTGVDEMDIFHDGTQGRINNLVGDLDTDTATGIYNFGLNETTDSVLRVYDSDKTDYIQFTHDSTQAAISSNVGNIDLNPAGYLKSHKDIHIFTSPAANRSLNVYNASGNIMTVLATGFYGTAATGFDLAATGSGLVKVVPNTYAGDPEFRVYSEATSPYPYISLQHDFTNATIKTTKGELILGAPTTVTIGTGAAGVDYILKIDGETTDITFTYMEDEGRLDISQSVALLDNKKMYFGTDFDASAYYDGTDMVINPVELGSGQLKIPGQTRIAQGTTHDGFVTMAAGEVQTTDATVTVLKTKNLLDENTYIFNAWVVGVQSTGANRASYHIEGTFYRIGGGNAVQQGTTTVLHSAESDASWDAAFTVSGAAVRVSVTGKAAQTIDWGCTLNYLNVGNA